MALVHACQLTYLTLENVEHGAAVGVVAVGLGAVVAVRLQPEAA